MKAPPIPRASRPLLLLTLVGGIIGCETAPATSVAPPSATATGSVPAPASAGEPPLPYPSAAVPIEVDFEERAEKEINADNYRERLAELVPSFSAITKSSQSAAPGAPPRPPPAPPRPPPSAPPPANR